MRGEITPKEFQRRAKIIRLKYEEKVEEICNMNSITGREYFNVAELIERITADSVRKIITKISNNSEIEIEISEEEYNTLNGLTTRLKAPRARKVVTEIHDNEEVKNNMYITAMGKSCIISDADDEREF